MLRLFERNVEVCITVDQINYIDREDVPWRVPGQSFLETILALLTRTFVCPAPARPTQESGDNKCVAAFILELHDEAVVATDGSF